MGSPASLFVISKVTSEVFNEENPPMDWADAGLLIPHEAIRRQMKMMVQSVNAMPDDSPPEGEAWKITLFSQWFIDYFYESVHEHHDAEEKIYFPWMKTKTTIPEKEFSGSHVELMSAMDGIKKVCAQIINKQGKGCGALVAELKKDVPKFDADMRAHLKEEEETVPELLRNNFTHEEEGVIVEQILQAGGLALAKKFLPAVLLAAQEWMSETFYADFVGSIPPPIKHLVDKYYMPDFENVVMNMRDAPTLASKPNLKRVPCCRIPFCFPCDYMF
jgi:hemerythrin-like domain-containing protein